MNDFAKDAIAMEVAAGLSFTSIAQAHGYASVAGVKSLIATPDMQERIAHHKDVLQVKAQQLLAKSWMSADAAINNVTNIIRDPGHAKSFDASKWLLDRLWPSKQQDQNVNISIPADVLTEIGKHLGSLRKLKDDSTTTDVEVSPHLREGKAVIQEQRSAASLIVQGNGRDDDTSPD